MRKLLIAKLVLAATMTAGCYGVTAAEQDLMGDTQAVPPITDDRLGEQSLARLQEQLASLEGEYDALLAAVEARKEIIDTKITLLTSAMQARESEIAKIKREDEYRYFTVRVGSFRKELIRFSQRLGIQTVRWHEDIPKCVDWDFDTSFQIDITNRKQALDGFFKGLPLIPKLWKRDDSLNISPTEVFDDCQ